MKLLKLFKKGFTLVELVVVIAIIAILSGVSVGAYVGITSRAQQTAADAEANTIGTVVRAAVLMNAEGYELDVDNDQKVDYVATWDKNAGVVFTFGDDDAVTTEKSLKELIALIYTAVEGNSLKGTITVPAGTDTVEPVYKTTEGKIKQFEYTPAESNKTGTYKFVA